METSKKVVLGEYTIIMKYNVLNGSLKVSILDELEEEIESIEVSNDTGETDNIDPFQGLLN